LPDLNHEDHEDHEQSKALFTSTHHRGTETVAFAFGYGAQADVGLPAEALAEAGVSVFRGSEERISGFSCAS
jgi:hypothetical protein